MIVVYTESQVYEYEDATRFATDEHNNLEIYGGPVMKGQPPEVLMDVFAEGVWLRAGVSMEDDE